jgi:hypothetical protein
VPDDRVVADHRVPALAHVAHAQHGEAQAHQGHEAASVEGHEGESEQQQPHDAQQPDGIAHREVFIEFLQPGMHRGDPLRSCAAC